MKVLVDTSIWSASLRRDADQNQEISRTLGDLIASYRAQIIGPIRQEVLSGVRDESQFSALADHLSAFPDVPILPEDYVTGARFFNLCRRKGIQGSNTDFLISAVAARNGMSIFTLDNNFRDFAKVVPIRFFE
jgi:hypothetical protein